MEKKVYINEAMAIRAGVNKTGTHVVEYDPAQLTQAQRDWLADNAGRVPSMADNTLADLLAYIDTDIREKKEAAEKKAAEVEAKIQEWLALSDDDFCDASDDDFCDAYLSPMWDPNKTALLDPRLADRLALREVRHAAEKAEKDRLAEIERQENKRKCDEWDAARIAGTETLRQWGIENGSELLKIRIEENINWAKLAENEYIAANAPWAYEEIGEPDEVKDRTQPTVEEIKELRRLRDICAASDGVLTDPELRWYVVESTFDEDEREETPGDKFAVCRVTVNTPTGEKRWVEKRMDKQ